jgi:hypothetical protein
VCDDDVVPVTNLGELPSCVGDVTQFNFGSGLFASLQQGITA